MAGSFLYLFQTRSLYNSSKHRTSQAELNANTFTQSLFLGLSFYNQPVSQQGVQNQIFSFFMLLVIQIFMCYQAMPNFITQRNLYEARERPAKTYTWKAFMLGNLFVEVPWNTLAALIIFICM